MIRRLGVAALAAQGLAVGEVLLVLGFDGLDAPVMDLATGRRNRIPVAQLVRRTLREIEPHARELGSERELEGIPAILARGNSADRQLRIFNANRDINEVVEEIALATETLPAAATP